MPSVLSDTFRRLPLSSITVLRGERQRRIIDTSGLEKSIERFGVLQPIIVRADTDAEIGFTLVAGERRLQACKNLGLPDIPVRFASDLSPVESAIIELEENIKRSDLEWKDLVRAVERVHQLHLALEPTWTLTETADVLSLDRSTVSLHLRVASELADPRISAASGAREAYNILTRRDQRQLGNALEELLRLPDPASNLGLATQSDLIEVAGIPCVTSTFHLPSPSGPPPVESIILQESFLTWASSWQGPKFSFIHCDFPYGAGAFEGSQGIGSEPSGYLDSPDLYWQLLDCLTENLDRLLSLSGHLMFWYSARNLPRTMEVFRQKAPSLSFQVHPLIWLKSDNAGVCPDPRRLPRHIYETALLASRGDRHIVKVVADAYSCSTNHQLHPSTKPEGMLRHFFSMLVDDFSTVLDPTCGSGTSIRAAEGLGASSVLGLEIDEGYCAGARQALKNARLLRHGAELVRS